MVWLAGLGRAGVALSAIGCLSMLGCQSGVLDGRGSGSLGIDGGRVGTAKTGTTSTIGPGGSSDASTPRLLSCDAQVPVAPDWTEVPAAPGLEGLAIKDAWAAAPDDLFFVGILPVPGNDVQSLAQVVRWTRGCWRLETSATIPSQLTVAISGASSGDVWAAMGSGLFRRDGTGWSRADAEMQALLTAAHPGRDVVATGVRVASDAVWVIGESFIWRRDAGGWRMFELTAADVFGPDDPTGSRGSFWFTSMSTRGRDDVAIGGAVHLLGRIPNTAFVYRYDGATWIRRIVSDGEVAAVWTDGAGGLWIGDQNGGRNAPLLHDDGLAMNPVFIDGWPTGVEAAAIWGRAPDDLFAANAGSLAHWDGAAWTMTSAPPTTVAADDEVMAGAEGAMWIVRSGPHFFHRDR